MSASRRSMLASAGLLSAFCMSGQALQAWEDPFGQWKASAYLQVLQMDRPSGGMALSGFLDNQGDASSGYNQDGLFVRKLETKLWGPLGWEGWEATLGIQTDLLSTGLSDAFVQWSQPAWGLQIKLGQEHLPFGQEQQLSGARLITIQRSLAYGFANYGHVRPWGLGMLNERGWGLRGDWNAQLAGPFSFKAQAGAFQEGALDFAPGWAGLGRAALDFASGPASAELGYSAYAGRSNLSISSAHYAPLGTADLATASPAAGAGAGGRATVLTWGPDASADLGPLHGRAELAWQDLGGLERGGASLTAYLDLPWPQERKPDLYARAEQIWSGFGDGVHRPGSLYRARTFGVNFPLPWAASLKLEDLELYGDDFPGGFPGARIEQAQLQLEF